MTKTELMNKAMTDDKLELVAGGVKMNVCQPSFKHFKNNMKKIWDSIKKIFQSPYDNPLKKPVIAEQK